MLKNLVIQITVFGGIFLFLSWIKTTSMLSYGDSAQSEQFVLTTLDSQLVTVNNSNKRLVLYFFAPWCSICHASISNLQQLYISNENIDVIAIALDFVDENEVREFAQQHQLTFPITFGNERVKQFYQIEGYPSYYVLDENNTVISKSIGYSTEIGLYIRSL
ncbi:TlpA family protein disulfide reductase [Thalassotalea ganghwensis]